jgi:hypothetical protein
VLDDEGMTRSRPRAGGPKRRRSFTPAEKLAHLVAYDQACQSGQGGAYLRREGMYSSQGYTLWHQIPNIWYRKGRHVIVWEPADRLRIEHLHSTQSR